jgi:hypothetical protein
MTLVSPNKIDFNSKHFHLGNHIITKTSKMIYLSRNPNSIDNQFEKTKEKYSTYTFSTLSPFGLYCAGMGSGKSNIIAHMPSFIKFKGLVTILLKDKNLMKQMRMNLVKFERVLKFVILDGSNHGVIRKVAELISSGKQPIVLFCHLGTNSGKFTSSTRKFVDLLEYNKSKGSLVLIDEIDSVITNLTGGMNAKLDHSKNMLDSYIKVKSQVLSLNLFDKIRRNNAKVIGFTGTANNLVCSKLPSTGYSYEDIHIMNMRPIKSIYENINIIRNDMDPASIIDLYENEIMSVDPDKKILIVFRSEDELRDCMNSYTTRYGRDMPCVMITQKTEDERLTVEWQTKFQASKYVLGINLVGIGFDISTFCEGQEFGLVIICRKLSDSISQPLSKNRDHDLHMETSASMLQIIARMRKGGTAIIPESVEIDSFYDGMQEIYYTIRDGRNEMLKVGPPRSTQAERQNQCILLALIQNMRSENNRPVVRNILTKLNQITKRQFEDEYLRGDFDPVYWTDRIGDVWASFIGEDVELVQELVESPVQALVPGQELTEELFEHESAEQEAPIESTFPILGDHIAGGGERNIRVENEKIREAVIKRAAETCGHCGSDCSDGKVNQICHVQRNDCDGPFSLDNLIYGHVCCDSAFDCGFIVYDPDGGTWQHPTLQYKPDQKQWSEINPDYLRHRWDWEKERQNHAEKNNNSFRKYLIGKGYLQQE